MSDPQEQLTFDQLPPWVRERFEVMRRRLGSALTIGNLRTVKYGWAASIFTLDGHNGGDVFVPDEPAEPLPPPPWANSRL